MRSPGQNDPVLYSRFVLPKRFQFIRKIHDAADRWYMAGMNFCYFMENMCIFSDEKISKQLVAKDPEIGKWVVGSGICRQSRSKGWRDVFFLPESWSVLERSAGRVDGFGYAAE